jgi:hypothetical protein
METEKKKSSMVGIWFMYPIDQGIPATVTIYSGSVQGRKGVRTISKMQALALARWHRHPGLYHSYRDGNGNWRDVRVVGDLSAWHGEE